MKGGATLSTNTSCKQASTRGAFLGTKNYSHFIKANVHRVPVGRPTSRIRYREAKHWPSVRQFPLALWLRRLWRVVNYSDKRIDLERLPARCKPRDLAVDRCFNRHLALHALDNQDNVSLEHTLANTN